MEDDNYKYNSEIDTKPNGGFDPTYLWQKRDYLLD
jgi:hypothetical protein